MKTYKRTLSNAQAARCENATGPRCKCRCGGALHGKGHQSYQTREREILIQGQGITTEQIKAIIEPSPVRSETAYIEQTRLPEAVHA